jgi:hypothetical protein
MAYYIHIFMVDGSPLSLQYANTDNGQFKLEMNNYKLSRTRRVSSSGI